MTDRVEQSKMKEQQIPLYQLASDVLQHGIIPLYSTNSLRLVNSVAESVHEAVNLFEATVNSDEMWSNRNREVRIVCEELLENAHELAKLLSRFRRGFSSNDLINEDISFHRLGYLLILQLATRYFTTFHLTSVRSPQLFQELADAVYDPTLYLTHYTLHTRIRDACEASDQFSETKRIMTSMSKAVDFLQDTTKDALQSCNEALLSFPLHRHPDIVPKFLRLCQGSSSSNELQKNLIVITLLKMLGHQDQQLQTDCYLSLHALVQDVLGEFTTVYYLVLGNLTLIISLQAFLMLWTSPHIGSIKSGSFWIAAFSGTSFSLAFLTAMNSSVRLAKRSFSTSSRQ